MIRAPIARINILILNPHTRRRRNRRRTTGYAETGAGPALFSSLSENPSSLSSLFIENFQAGTGPLPRGEKRIPGPERTPCVLAIQAT